MNHMTVDSVNAPWNETEPDTEEVEVTVSITLSKSMRIAKSDYQSLEDSVEEQCYLPNNLAIVIERLFNEDLDLKAAGMPKYLKEAIEDCKDWDIDEFEVIEE